MYLIWGIPLIILIINIIIIILFILIPYFSFGFKINIKYINFITFGLWVVYFYLLHQLTYNRIDQVKKNCYEYGKDIIIQKTPMAVPISK